MSLIKRDLTTFPKFNNLLDQFFNNDFFDMTTRNFSKTDTTLPAVNIKEENERFVVEMAAPGMKKEDFKIELNNNLLIISSEKKEEKVENGDSAQYTRREFSYQSFVRSFTLPESVEHEKIEAKYEDGVLKLHIPKKEEAKPKPARTIEISS